MMTKVCFAFYLIFCSLSLLASEEISLSRHENIAIKEFALKESLSFHLSNTDGGIEVYESQSDSVLVEAQLRGTAQGKLIIEDLDSQELAIKATGSVDLKVGIPRQFLRHLKMNSLKGDLVLSGHFLNGLEKEREIVLKSLEGDIRIKEITAGQHLFVDTEKGNIFSENIVGRQFVRLVNGRGHFHGNSGGIDVIGGSGELELLENQGELNVTGKKMNTSAKYNQGSIDILLDRGQIDLVENRGSIYAKTMQGRLSASGNDGDLIATVVNSKLRVESQTGPLMLITSDSGDIYLDNPLHNDIVTIKTHTGKVTNIPKEEGLLLRLKNCQSGASQFIHLTSKAG